MMTLNLLDNLALIKIDICKCKDVLTENVEENICRMIESLSNKVLTRPPQNMTNIISYNVTRCTHFIFSEKYLIPYMDEQGYEITLALCTLVLRQMAQPHGH